MPKHCFMNHLSLQWNLRMQKTVTKVVYALGLGVLQLFLSRGRGALNPNPQRVQPYPAFNVGQLRQISTNLLLARALSFSGKH